MDLPRLPRQVFHISRSQVPACGHLPHHGAMDDECPRACAGPGWAPQSRGCSHPREAMRAPGNSPRTGGAGGISWVLKVTRVSKPREERALLRDKNVPEVSGGLLPPHGARGSPEKSRLAPRGPHPRPSLGLPSGIASSMVKPWGKRKWGKNPQKGREMSPFWRWQSKCSRTAGRGV